jgi:hypothetical protein
MSHTQTIGRSSHSLAIIGFLVLILPVYLPARAAGSSIAGTYRCASQNAGGIGRKCTSPPLILGTDGKYQISSEHGTYYVSGGRLYLSESRLRGSGKIGANQLVFEYSYRGSAQTVIYRREQQAVPANAAQSRNPEIGNDTASIPVRLKIDFDRPDGWLGWVNTAKLAPLASEAGNSITGIVVSTSRQSVLVSFRSVPAGRRYELQLGSGTANYAVTIVDIARTQQSMEQTISAKIPNSKQLR